MIGMLFWLQAELTSRRGGFMMPDWSNPGVVAQILIGVLIVLLCGCIARAIYSHRRLWEVFAIFAVIVVFFGSIDASFGWVMVTVRDLVGDDSSIDLPDGFDMKRRALMLLPIAVVFVMGLGLGVLMNLMIAKSERTRVSKIRRRLRRRRAKHE